MEVSRIDHNVGIAQRDNQDQAKKKPVQLFNTSGFQTGGFQQDFSALTSSGAKNLDDTIDALESKQTIRLSDGTDLDIPALTSEQKADADRIYSNMTPEAAAAAKSSAFTAADAAYTVAKAMRTIGTDNDPIDITSANSTLRAAVQNMVQIVAEGMLTSTGSAQKVFRASNGTSSSTYTPPTPTNQNLSPQQLSAGMTDAMTIGMTAVEDELHQLLESFTHKQELGTEVQTDATELSEMLGDWPEGSSQSFTWHEQTTDAEGNLALVEKTDVLSKEEAEALLQKLQSSAEGLGAISSLDQYKLQVLVQDYQQAMTTLSNVMKNYDDDLKSIINNLR